MSLGDVFAKTVQEWTDGKVPQLTEAILKKSVERLAEDANTSRFKGGAMPIDTSFLVNSIAARIGNLPSGVSVRPKNYTLTAWNSAQITTVINKMKLGDVVFIGWTAKYAPNMENRYGFVRLATQNWSNIVSLSALEARAAFNAK